MQDKEDICRIEEKDMREYHDDTTVSIHKDKEDLCRIDKQHRRTYHDDITVIILFMKDDEKNDDLASRSLLQGNSVSIRSPLEH